jgi:hypothetical protein
MLTMWETVAVRVATRAFAGGMTVLNEQELDAHEEAAARAAAEDAARRAREHGWAAEGGGRARPLPNGAPSSTSPTRASSYAGPAGLAACGGLVRGSVSHAVLQHSGRPVIAPAPPVSEP